jgi:hypothetical protein
MLLFFGLSLEATKVLMEKDLKASCTLKVPTAESFLPVNGRTSGPLWQELLRLTLQTKLTSTSISGAKASTLSPNKLTC